MTTPSNRTRANRLNAKKSTGPLTGQGRTRASLNRLLHGLRASTPVLPGENPGDLIELTGKVAADVQAQGVIEEFIAARIAMGMWRLRRAERAELGILASKLLEVEAARACSLRQSCEADPLGQPMFFEVTITDEAGHREATAQLAEIGAAAEDDLPTLGRAVAKDAAGPGTIDLAVRYMTAIERSLFRTLRELRDLQAARTRS
jgi:hypothetical protein